MTNVVFSPNRTANDEGENARYDSFCNQCADGEGDWSCQKAVAEGQIYIFWFGDEKQQIAGIGISQGEVDLYDDPKWPICHFDPLVPCKRPVTGNHIKRHPTLGTWWKSKPYARGAKIIPDEAASALISLIGQFNARISSLVGGHTRIGPALVQSIFIPDEDENPPAKIKCQVTRVVRCTEKGNRLKELYNHECQLCGYHIVVPNPSARGYVEIHHMTPLGGTHKGFDNWNNMLVLCPNCHVEFDILAMAIDPKTGQIICCDKNNAKSGKEIRYRPGHLLSDENLEYHNKRFRKAIGA